MINSGLIQGSIYMKYVFMLHVYVIVLVYIPAIIRYICLHMLTNIDIYIHVYAVD